MNSNGQRKLVARAVRYRGTNSIRPRNLSVGNEFHASFAKFALPAIPCRSVSIGSDVIEFG